MSKIFCYLTTSENKEMYIKKTRNYEKKIAGHILLQNVTGPCQKEKKPKSTTYMETLSFSLQVVKHYPLILRCCLTNIIIVIV